jgi:hypothetical protein
MSRRMRREKGKKERHAMKKRMIWMRKTDRETRI